MSYESERKNTLKTLKKEGTFCTLRKPIKGQKPVYDPETDTTTIPSTSHSGYCVLSDINESLVDGELIKTGDIRILCLFEDKRIPEVGVDKIIVNPGTTNEVEYSVAPGSKAIIPDGKTCVLFKALGRR